MKKLDIIRINIQRQIPGRHEGLIERWFPYYFTGSLYEEMGDKTHKQTYKYRCDEGLTEHKFLHHFTNYLSEEIGENSHEQIHIDNLSDEGIIEH